MKMKNTTSVNQTGINKRDIWVLKTDIMDRVDHIFSSRPTWSRMQFLDDETIHSIQQIIEEETAKLEKKLQS